MSTQSSRRYILNIDAQHILTLVLKLSRVEDYKSTDVDTVLRKVSLTSSGVPHIHPTLVWREKHKKPIASSGSQGALFFSLKWLHAYQLSALNDALWNGFLII